jgi:uncharacterized protein YggE
MQRFFWILSVFFLLISSAYAVPPVMPPVIDVTGYASVKAVPDFVVLSFSIEKNSKDLAAIQREAEDITTRITSYAKGSLQVEEGDIQSRSFTVTPVYEQSKKNNYQRSGVLSHFTLQKGMEIKLTQLDQLQPLIDYAVEAGVTSVGSLSFDTSKRTELESEARKNATRNARAQAEDVAAALGVRVGAPYHITIGAAAKPASGHRGMELSVLSVSRESSFAPGQIAVQATVNISFTIDD